MYIRDKNLLSLHCRWMVTNPSLFKPREIRANMSVAGGGGNAMCSSSQFQWVTMLVGGGGRGRERVKKKGARQTAEYPFCPLPSNSVVLKQVVSGSEHSTIPASVRGFVRRCKTAPHITYSHVEYNKTTRAAVKTCIFCLAGVWLILWHDPSFLTWQTTISITDHVFVLSQCKEQQQWQRDWHTKAGIHL